MKTYDDYFDEYQNEVEEYENYNNEINDYKKNLIFKIIIIIVCVILLIWLFLLLKNNNKSIVYDETLHMENITKVRLAAEKYFFNENNLPKNNESKKINLKTLINKGLINDIVDANNKVCSDNNSMISLTKESTYILRIKLSCSTDEPEEIYFYDIDTFFCERCNGITNIDIPDDNKKEDPIVEPTDKDDIKPIDNEYSCKEFSPWQSKKEDSEILTERTRTLVKGVKKGNTIVKETYGNWSEYILNPIMPEDNIEIERLDKTETRWSENKETTSYIENSDRIRIIDTRVSGGGVSSYCASGYSMSGNICVSNQVYTADLTPSQYNSYYVINKPCNDSQTEYINGTFVLMRKGCRYRLTDSIKTSTTPSTTTYIYQELEEYPVTYYRYRKIEKEVITEDDIYTEDYYEINSLPSGYEKVPGSEKIEYSYKITVCEK